METISCTTANAAAELSLRKSIDLIVAKPERNATHFLSDKRATVNALLAPSVVFEAL
jgi:hypothetical protein